MKFEELRAKEIRAVVRYKTETRSWVAKGRADHIVGIQLRGRAEHTFNFGNFEISEDCVYFLNRRDDYKTEVSEPCEAFSIHFTTYEDIETPSFCVPSSNPSAIVSILQKAEAAKNSGDTLSLRSLLYRLAAEIGYARDKIFSPRDMRMEKAKEYIDSHFKEYACLERAVEESGIGARRFSELFKESFNITPSKYITSQKIEYAKSLLTTGHFAIAEVSEMCSFSDIYYFSKVFKKETGITPSEYRKTKR